MIIIALLWIVSDKPSVKLQTFWDDGSCVLHIKVWI